jgi:hypothetical protein
MNKRKTCTYCGDDGICSFGSCPDCGGSGTIEFETEDNYIEEAIELLEWIQ